jgi:hypothetical protein
VGKFDLDGDLVDLNALGQTDGPYPQTWAPAGKIGGCEATDADGDGFYAGSGAGKDCNDFDDTVYPGAVENKTNGQDDDCDGQIDE